MNSRDQHNRLSNYTSSIDYFVKRLLQIVAAGRKQQQLNRLFVEMETGENQMSKNVKEDLHIFKRGKINGGPNRSLTSIWSSNRPFIQFSDN